MIACIMIDHEFVGVHWQLLHIPVVAYFGGAMTVTIIVELREKSSR